MPHNRYKRDGPAFQLCFWERVRMKGVRHPTHGVLEDLLDADEGVHDMATSN